MSNFAPFIFLTVIFLKIDPLFSISETPDKDGNINVTFSSFVRSSINCTNCSNCTNVVNCINCVNVHDSSNIFYSNNVNKSSNVSYSSYIFDSINVTGSQNCVNCKNCKNCTQCTDCIGYYCKNENGCRNSKWKFVYWEPDQNDQQAWKCKNPLLNDLNFNVAGYRRPPFLDDAEVHSDLDFCYAFQGNRSCCNKTTSSEIRKIFEHYKETLQLRSSKKIQDLTRTFEQYKAINFSTIDGVDIKAIKQAVVDQMRYIKVTIYNMAKTMATCGKSLLNYLAAMLCLGCMPDWQWQRFVTARNPFQDQKVFDPDAMINATFDLEKDPIQFNIKIGRQICEDMNSNCKSLLDNFNLFANKSALAVGGFADEITNNQWVWDEFNNTFKGSYRENITKEIKDLSKRNVSWIKPHGEENNNSIDIRTDPIYDPNDQQKKMSYFKSSMRALGKDYTYDPVNYYSFDPSINFEDPLVMDEDVCIWLTHAQECIFCYDTATKLRSGLPACAQIPADIFEIQEETDRQYRDFSVFFFQIRAAIINYTITDNGPTQTIIRHFLFPAFREAEIYMQLKDQPVQKRKEYFETLEQIIINQYKVFKTKKDSQDEFKIWNDEYWMNFIYAPAFIQGRNFFRELSRLLNLTGDYKFNCDYDGYCKLCLVPSQVCVNVSGYNKYCEDCHFSNVRLSSECSNEACITCIYIGGDGDLPYNDTDIEGFEGLENDLEEMEKCFIRPSIPFFDEKLEEGGNYYAPFYRESDEANYLKIEQEFDLKDESNTPWNIAKIGEWFYKINGSEVYSVINIMKIDNTLKIPNTTNCTHYDYTVPCSIESPINYCKKWLCNFINTYLFPDFKLVYDPQNKNNSEFSFLFDKITKDTFDIDLYNKSLAYVEIHQRNKWNISYVSSDPTENESFYDVATMGLKMGTNDDFYLRIADVTEDTDIIRFVENDEEDAFGVRWSVEANLIIVILSIILVV